MKTETMADIVAMLRANASGERFDDFSFSSLADRIEAAYKREHAEWHAETDAAKEERNRIACRMRYEFAAKCRACKTKPGNDADAIRDALDDAHRLIEAFLATSGDRGMRSKFVEMRYRINAALAAPARNADRFADPGEAWLAYKAECDKNETVPNMIGAISWLLATAEGGAKCIDGLRGRPDCRGCEEHCLDVRKRNCFYWNPDIEGGVCALTGKKSCPISCDNFHIPESVSPPPAEGEKE